MKNVGYIGGWVSSVLVGAGLPGSCCYSVEVTEASNQSDEDSRYKVTGMLNVHAPGDVAGQAVAELARLQADARVNARLQFQFLHVPAVTPPVAPAVAPWHFCGSF